jgi:hypothetical protein
MPQRLPHFFTRIRSHVHCCCHVDAADDAFPALAVLYVDGSRKHEGSRA